MFFLVFVLVSNGTVFGQGLPDFSNIPVSQTVEDSANRFPLRRQTVIDFFALQSGMVDFKQDGAESFYGMAIAKLWMGRDVALVNQKLLASTALPYGEVGTNIDLGICKRKGDYDFMMIGLVHLLSLFQDRPDLLWPESKRKLLNTLIPVRGASHHTQFSLGLCGTHNESENHVLMIEISRYLVNQVWLKELTKAGRYLPQFDNAKSGFEEWMLLHLQEFFRKNFSEYNSIPYQVYTIVALQILHRNAEGPRVKLAAQMLLEFLSMQYSIQSMDARRSVPFRRLPEYRDLTDLLIGDGLTAVHALLVGNYKSYSSLPRPFVVPQGYTNMLIAATDNYEVPALISDYMMRRASPFPVYQRFRHEGVEIYSKSENFTLAAGGIYVNHGGDFGTDANAGWAAPTVVLPKGEAGSNRNDFFGFLGHTTPQLRNNTCVGRNFACGMNPYISAKIPVHCREVRGPWTFLKLTSKECSENFDYKIFGAVYDAPCDSHMCSSDGRKRFGLLEVAEAKNFASFAEFRDGILSRNPRSNYSPASINTYVTAIGDRIEFTPVPDTWNFWPISRVNGQVQDVTFRTWRLAQGSIMDARGDGMILYRHPETGDRLTLDFRDALNPQRRLEGNGAFGVSKAH